MSQILRLSAMNPARRFRRGFVGVLLCAIGVLAPAAAAPPISHQAAVSGSTAIFVIAGGWHTELALPVTAIDGPLRALAARFPEARYLVFGWGARGYYMAQHPGLADLLRAATPGPAVMLVIPLAVPPASFAGPGNTFRLSVSVAGARRLALFLWSDLVSGRNPVPRGLGPGPEPRSAFYAAAGTYDLSHTCNTWTAEALRAAGVRVSAAGVVFAGQLLDQLRERR